jgi:capsular polysaccharide biosynthesis protein
MSILSRFARRMAEGYYSHPLLTVDSFLFRPVYRCAGLVSHRFRSDQFAAIRRFEQAPEVRLREVLPARSGWCYPPRRFGLDGPVAPQPVEFPSVRVAVLAGQVVEAGSSYPFDRRRRCVYVDQEFDRLPPNGSFVTGHLTGHGRRMGLVRQTGELAVAKDGVFLGGNGSGTYYHWLVEIVTKLQVLPDAPETAGLPLLVSRRVAELPSFAEILKVLAPERGLVFLEEGVSYLVNKVVFIEPLVTAPFHIRDCKFRAGNFSTRPEAIGYLRERVLPRVAAADGAGWPRRIFLARGQRRTFNQEELLAVAARHGFEALRMEEHPFLKQAGYFANAEAIIGPTGAAWSNLVFANPDCRALCWIPEELEEFAAFSNLAGIVGLDFRHLTYPSGVRSPAEAYGHSYRICPDRLQEILVEITGP